MLVSASANQSIAPADSGLDHCLEAVRSSVMCYPDLTLHPLVWGDIKGHPLLASPNVPRKCVDWGKLMEWSSTRHYTYADIEAAMKEAGREIPS